LGEEALIIVQSVKSKKMGKISFNDIVLEEVNLGFFEHETFIDKLIRDRDIQKEFFLSKGEFVSSCLTKEKEELLSNNSFIVRIFNIPIGYLETSPISNGTISISIGIEKSFRGNGYGSLILKSLTDYLLNRDDINRISAIISPSNLVSIKLFEGCGFKRCEDIPNCFVRTKIYQMKH